MSTNKHLVLIGGGHTHALLLKQWAASPVDNVRVSLINPGRRAAYSGMLPGYVAGHYALQDLQLNLDSLAHESGASLIEAAATGIDTDQKIITLSTGETLSYDLASIDIGITTGLTTLKGFSDFGVAAKPLDYFAHCWQQFLKEVQAGKKPPHVAIIGGGVAGCRAGAGSGLCTKRC